MPARAGLGLRRECGPRVVSEADAVLGAVDPEAMQVGALPTEGDLQYGVQVGDGGIGAYEEATHAQAPSGRPVRRYAPRRSRPRPATCLDRSASRSLLSA